MSKRLLSWFARRSVDERRQMAMAGMLPFAVTLFAGAPVAGIGAAALVGIPSSVAFAYLMIRYPVPRTGEPGIPPSLPGLEAVAEKLGLARDPDAFRGEVRGVPVAIGSLLNTICGSRFRTGIPPSRSVRSRRTAPSTRIRMP